MRNRKDESSGAAGQKMAIANHPQRPMTGATIPPASADKPLTRVRSAASPQREPRSVHSTNQKFKWGALFDHRDQVVAG